MILTFDTFSDFIDFFTSFKYYSKVLSDEVVLLDKPKSMRHVFTCKYSVISCKNVSSVAILRNTAMYYRTLGIFID